MQACTKTHHFEIKNAKIFCEGGRGQPLPDPTLSAPTALKLNATPPKILVTALGPNSQTILGES